MAAEMPLALLREPLEIDWGLDIVDSRNGEILAWGPNYTVIPLAERLNEVYPDREEAPDHDALKRELPRHLNELG